MGNLTKEQLEKRLDEVLAELDTERKKTGKLEIDLKSAQTELEAVRKNLADEKRRVSDLTEVGFKNLEVINDLQAKAEKASAPAGTNREALIREKIRAGLSRQQAEEVIKAQEAEDARRAKAEEDED